ncbi:MAG: YebC/PmpR family DNA-binding transcriptional regulator [Candidatus Omnitrophica bacterium]|nr:YebC/PmpR family DNA-binding transcriptional regulator [Candidatus Omnitrophota bacterium]MBU0897053.1 YebC/PmpR family DNA-binding transcriptional regulator [Candidatus Omnitrophota bacterium]MBU1134174.1 YebC/PmpR family DNA-binding transcriptional regulator [Candidatus Omnitrophota bacterium]MBU1366206.1 YebC/PmpR family DNA-binding transcriptional regulator [Candidatus Omnitrophota bacterium]MBU1523077.1 YebC/PmpR family DNA-binding transcriptional regulator [Candidatus Omnitrophota bact
MSGHSKWAGIKHKKAAQDAKRGRIFTKLIREITVAARAGGGIPETNAALRAVIDRAKDANMPQDNVEKAIKKGTGELPGVTYEECMFEGYAAGGVAILVEALTDNKNRTSAEIRNIFSKKGGNLAGGGSVAWMFNKKGYVLIDKSLIGEDELFSISVDAGAEDVKTGEKNYEVFCDSKDFENLKKALKSKGINWEIAELTMVPTSTIKVTGSQARQVLSLAETLEDHEDAQKVYANFDIPDEILEELAGESS